MIETFKPEDIINIRKDFPIFNTGKKLIYLDSAATSQKPSIVIDAIHSFYSNSNANVHRGIYTLSEEATIKYEEAHKKVAGFINAKSFREIVFVRNTTEAINLIAYSWGRKNIGKGDVIILSQMEHHSNIVPWQILAREKGAVIKYAEIDNRGKLRIESLESLLKGKVKLVAITQMSNVLGTINPVKKITSMAHKAGAVVLIDGAQGVPHEPTDVQDIGCDFYAFSGHKMLGPTGVGVLYGKKEMLNDMPPFLGGGDMIKSVSFEEARWNDLPWKFEAGTPAIAEGIALGVAIDYLKSLGMTKIRNYENELALYAMDKLKDVNDIEIYGHLAEERGGIVSFNLKDVHPHDVASVLSSENIAIRAGHHCAQPLHDRLGVSASSRASFYIYNTTEEIDALVNGLKKARKIYG